MRLNDPSTIDQAIENIKSLQFQLGNAQSAMSAEGKRDNFVNWCEERARDVLEFLFDPSEEIFDELETAYLRAATTNLPDIRLFGLMNREFTRWRQNLSRIERLLLDQQAVRSIPGHRIVPETSVLMEADPAFIKFPWHTAHPEMATGQIRLIVPIIVVEQLDELLHNRDGERKRKARDAVRALLSVHKTSKPTERAPLPGKPEVTLEIMVDEPWHKRLPVDDAEIIDQASRLHQITGLAVLATCDANMYYRTGAADLPAFLVPRKDAQAPGTGT
jgi:PIN domain